MVGLIDMNITQLNNFFFFFFFNWIPSMAMLMTPKAIAEMAKMAIFEIMATIVMANVNFSMAIIGIQFKSIRQLAQ